MFRSARIKLTTWYFMIIMAITVSFSFAVYGILSNELDRVVDQQRLELMQQRPPFTPFDESLYLLDPALVAETKHRIAITLIMVNGLILTISTAAGYFLAGETLNPIKDMVEGQNRFVSDASHELRTPLTALKSEIEVNLRDKDLTLTDSKTLLKSNLEEVDNLQKLSDGLIRLSQYQPDGAKIAFEKVLIKPLIEQAEKKVLEMARKKQIKVTDWFEDENIAVEGNAQTLTELFVIFLDNAIKYSSPKTDVHVQVSRSSSNASIEIRDQGIGISQEDLPHLFDRFFRSEKSRTKGEASGYGLGLAIAKQIIDRHNGTIKVSSVVNKGTVFTIHLPLVKHNQTV